MLAPFVAGAAQVPPFRGLVNDYAGWLDPGDRAALERKLAAYERGSGNQFVVLIVPSLEGDPIEDFGIRVGDSWKVGKRGRDNGLLLVIAAAERKMRVEVGYGLEGEITDALSSQVIRNVLAPSFRRQDFAGGIDRAMDTFMRAAGGESVAVPREPSAARPRGSFGGWIIFILILLFLMRGRGAGGFLLGTMLGGGWSSHRRGGFGGGFGGGGFGGGGGGRFGGGGASGGW